MRGANECILCGEAYRGRKGGVCGECRRIVTNHRQNAVAAAGTANTVKLPDSWLNLGYSSPEAKTVERLLVQLFRSFPEAVWPWPEQVRRTLKFSGTYDMSGCPTTPRLVPSGIAQEIADLQVAIYNLARASEERGKQNGTNLLAMLNAGELTTSDFERRAGIVPEGK